MKLSGKAKSIIQSMAAAGGASRGSNGERDSEPPEPMTNPIAGLGAERRRMTAEAVSRPFNVADLRANSARAAGVDTASAARDSRLASILAGVSRAGSALAGPSAAPAPDEADYAEYIRRRRGY